MSCLRRLSPPTRRHESEYVVEPLGLGADNERSVKNSLHEPRAGRRGVYLRRGGETVVEETALVRNGAGALNEDKDQQRTSISRSEHISERISLAEVPSSQQRG